MLFVFSLIFMADTKLIYGYNFVAPLIKPVVYMIFKRLLRNARASN